MILFGLASINVPLMVLYIMGFFDAYVQSITEWSLLLYFNHIGFTSASDNSFFVRVFALSFLVPVIVNIPLSQIAARYGVRVTLFWSYFVSFVGMILLVVSRLSPYVYVVGHAFFSTFWSLRIIRLSAIASIVSPANRTTAIAAHQFLVPVGSIAGPATWLIVQQWRGYIEIWGLEFDRFSVNFVINCVTNACMAFLAFSCLPILKAPYSGSKQKKIKVSSSMYGTIQGDDIESEELSNCEEIVLSPSAKKFVRSRIIFFCILAFVVRGCGGVYQVVFQPVMVNVFKTSDAELGRIFVMIAMVAVIPPVIVMIMTKFLNDPQILLFGICLKLFGMILFLPIFGEISKVQIIVGYAITVKATLFFTTICVSVFSKVVGRYYNHSYVGYLWTCTMLGPAVAQGIVSRWIVSMYGSHSFGLFALPTVVALFVILSPKFRCYIDASLQHLPEAKTSLEVGDS